MELSSKLRGAVPRARVGLVVPTLNAGERWIAFLQGITTQSFVPDRLLNIDSASTDQTAEIAQSRLFEVVRIDRSQFNHGGTRQWAVDHLDDCAIIIFLTQDAMLADRDALSEIVACFDDPKVAVAYGRQIPHNGATPIEAHARLFNYRLQSRKKDLAAVEQLGTKVFFCSNSFAAYRRSTLLGLGGFRRDLILGEDMEFAARAIKAGYVNMYCSAAAVHHSHDYTIKESVARYFDIGVFDTENPWMRREFGSHGGEGARFVLSELQYLAVRGRSSIPRALILTIAKLVGYRLGRSHRLLPRAFKRKVSMFPAFWSEVRPI
jgi:rhamnosyltransferase